MSHPSRPLPRPAALLILVVATFAAFAPALTADFTSWDDYETVARNPLMLPPTARSLQAFWTRPHGHLYIPVTYTAWAATAQVAYEPASATTPPRLDPRFFHALNVLLHAAAACVAFLLLERLIRHRAAALGGAMLFALHPVQVESVAWVSGAKDVLCGLLSLVAVWLYVGFAQREAKKARRYVLATAAFVLAMLAKPTAMMLPLVVLVLDMFVLGRPVKTALRSIWPWLVLAIPCAVATKMFQPAPHAQEAAAALWARPLIAADALAFYVYKLIWPASLAIDYGRTPRHVIDTHAIAWTWLAPLVLAVAAGWLWRRRGAGAPAAALGVMIAVLLPVLGFAPFDFQTYSTVADHYMYLAMLGPALALAWVLARRRSVAIGVVTSCILLVLGVRTFAQARHWRDSSALFAHALDVNPRSFAAHSSLAVLAMENGEAARALALAKQAVDLRADPARLTTYAEALRHIGRHDDAIAALRRSIEIEPDHPPALANLSALLAEQGRLEEAIPLARRAVEADPASVQARFNLALMYLNTGQPAAARAELEAARRLDPSHAGALELLQRLP